MFTAQVSSVYVVNADSWRAQCSLSSLSEQASPWQHQAVHNAAEFQTLNAHTWHKSKMGADAQWRTHTGVNPVPHTLYRSGGGPSAPNPHRGPAFCLLSIITDMASSLSAICRLLCTQLPALFQEGLAYKDSVAPSALRGAVLDPQPPYADPPSYYSQALSSGTPQSNSCHTPKARLEMRGCYWGPKCPSVTQLALPQKTQGPAARCLNGS